MTPRDPGSFARMTRAWRDSGPGRGSVGGCGIGSVAPRAGAGLNTAVRQPPPDLVLIAGWHIRRHWPVIDRRWPVIDRCSLVIGRRLVVPGRGKERAEKNGAADDPCGDQQIATMAIVMPAVAIVIATRLHRQLYT